MAPCSPPHKREATKTFSMMAGVGVRFRPEYTGRRKGRQSWAPQAAQTCRGRRAAGPLGKRQEAGKADAQGAKWA